MKSAAGRIREHIQAVIFFFLSIIDIDRILFPVLTPLALNGGVVVLCHDAFLLHFISLKAVQKYAPRISPAAAAFTRIRELPGPVRLPDSFSGCRTTKKSLYLYHNFIETWGT